jgi:hypothetical protein
VLSGQSIERATSTPYLLSFHRIRVQAKELEKEKATAKATVPQRNRFIQEL